MQKWEYMFVETMLTTVVSVNGQKVAQERKGKYGSEYEGEHIYQFLAKVGSQGWQLTTDSNQGGSSWNRLILMKPMEDGTA